MKGKRKRILGVALSLMLMLSLIAFAAPVSAGTLSWSTVTIPSTTGKVLASGVDILDLAVAGDEDTIYAAAGAGDVISAILGTKGGGSATWEDTEKHSGSCSADLDSGTTTTAGDEGRIVIDMPSGTTLDDITSISWWVYAADGYPPHLDITLDCDKDTVVDPEDMLTAEMNLNCVGAPLPITTLTSQISYNTGWLQTFELTSGDGFSAITNSTIFWVTQLGGGELDAPSGTLAQWKAGEVANDPENEMPTLGISGNTTVLKLEIEVDNWVTNSEAYVDDVTINGVTYNLENGYGYGSGGLYKSTNAGATWSGVTTPSAAGDVQLVAVAPDDEDIVAIVADGTEVYVSTNGGTTWSDLGVPREGAAGDPCIAINDLAMSAEKGGKYYIAVAGEDTTGANVWYYDVYAASAYWHEINDKDGILVTIQCDVYGRIRKGKMKLKPKSKKP